MFLFKSQLNTDYFKEGRLLKLIETKRHQKILNSYQLFVAKRKQKFSSSLHNKRSQLSANNMKGRFRILHKRERYIMGKKFNSEKYLLCEIHVFPISGLRRMNYGISLNNLDFLKIT